MIIAKLTGQMNNMAKHKFASNVCEKALVTADAESRRLLIDEIMTPKQDGISPIMGLMKDSFGSRSRCFVLAGIYVDACCQTMFFRGLSPSPRVNRRSS